MKRILLAMVLSLVAGVTCLHAQQDPSQVEPSVNRAGEDQATSGSNVGQGRHVPHQGANADSDTADLERKRESSRDWPTYRGDAARSGYTDQPLPTRLSRRWTYRGDHAVQPAWPRDERMSFDRAHQVVVADGRVFFGSTVDGKVHALDAETGEPQWFFLTGGPVRFAPTVWKDRVFVVSDDGFLYCLKAGDGTLIDRWRGGPVQDRVLGNGHMISKWPARGGPVIFDDILYWAAGIWPSEGVFLYAINPDTGKVVWKNDDSGSITMPQPHGGANAASGVTAQGYLLATEDQLLVPTGRAVPAAFARADGEFQYYRLQGSSPRGGTFAMTAGPFFYNGGGAFFMDTGQLSYGRVDGAICRFADGILCGKDSQLRALAPVIRQSVDRKGKPVERFEHELLWQIEDVPAGTSLVVAGTTAVSSSGSRISTVDLVTKTCVWTDEVDGDACGLAVANGFLYVSTTSGTIHAYAAMTDEKPVVHGPEHGDIASDAKVADAAEEIIRRTGVTQGYCVDLGCGDGALALELARRTELKVIAIDADASNVARARQRLDAAGYYGDRVTVDQGDPAATCYPKYFANLVVSGRSLTEGPQRVAQAELWRLQRPYGGVRCIGKPGQMIVSERGRLEGAGQWTHLYASAANTLCSTDTIKGPLSILWFRDVDLQLPQRHGRGPAPLFYNGRLLVEGLNGLLAVDAYNGRPLWQFDIEGVLDAYDAEHLAGAAITGGNFCVADGSVLLRHKDRCYRIDAATGETISVYQAPHRNNGQPAVWGYLACEDGILFGSTANDRHIVRHAYGRADRQMKQQFSESTALFAIDVRSGRVLWRHDARQSIRNNAIAIGGGRVFLIDRPLAKGDLLSVALARRDPQSPPPPSAGHPTGQLVALDARTGRVIWSREDDVFGTMLVFSDQFDRLLMCYQSTRFKLPSERGGRMAVYRASDGQLQWVKRVDYQTRPLINGPTIIAHPAALDLTTGEAKPLPLAKSYGCGQLSGSKNLLLLRSATFAYYDLSRQAGLENFGGIRPGCWINALPVGGIVLLPDASAGCRCSYQNRAWAAFEGN